MGCTAFFPVQYKERALPKYKAFVKTSHLVVRKHAIKLFEQKSGRFRAEDSFLCFPLSAETRKLAGFFQLALMHFGMTEILTRIGLFTRGST